jgi:hypothetical protein
MRRSRATVSARPFDFLPYCVHRWVIYDFGMRALVIIVLAFLTLAIALPGPHQFVPLPTKPMPAVSPPDK